MSDLLNATAVEAAAELGRAEALTAPPEPYKVDADNALVVRTRRENEHTDVISLEQFLEGPLRQRGTAVIADPSDFTAYVNRLATESTTVWADIDSHRVTAVFNDHSSQLSTDLAGAAGWRDHQATLALKVDPDWKEWLSADGTLMRQEEFAEFLEDHARSIVEPDAATMYEVAANFSARSSSSFDRAVRVNSGDVQLTWSEVSDAQVKSAGKGTFEVPKQFVVSLSPFLGVPPVGITANLRWRVRDGNLGIGFKLLRPDLVVRDAFYDIARAINDGTGETPVLLGTPPRSITAL